MTLTYDYWIGKYEVTFDEYDRYCEEMRQSKPDDEGWGRGKRPVINISWFSALYYCNWLSEKEGLKVAYNIKGAVVGQLLDKNGNETTDITKVEGYRLPTEAEWEYAARGGKKSNGYKYSGSDDLGTVGWCLDNSGGMTHEVGGKKANELGIHDMSGNVWERCHECYARDYYKKSEQNNPINFVGDYVVIRGGVGVDTDKWNTSLGCRVANLASQTTTLCADFLGFRVVRTK